MGHPVTHFEVNARDASATQHFYRELFDWGIDTNNPMGYGIVDTRAAGHGIGGGIGASQTGRSWLTFYVETPDLPATLARAERLGGRTVMPPMEMAGTTFALFADPEGNVVGLAKTMPRPRRRQARARKPATRKTTKKTTARKTTAAKRPASRSRGRRT